MKLSSWIASLNIFTVIFIAALFLTQSYYFTYVKGQYGHYCYTANKVNKNIKHPVYFSSLQNCMNSK